MSCKEIAGISIAGNHDESPAKRAETIAHEETKKLRITYNEIFSNKNSK